MPRKPKQEKATGVFEKPKGSGIWWIRFTDENGRRRAESVGRFGDARDRYAARRLSVKTGTEINLGRGGRDSRGAKLSPLIDDAIRFSKANHRDQKSFRIRADVWRDAFGDRAAVSLKPAELREWLDDRTEEWEWAPATYNRYKAVLSKVYQLALQDSKVPSNPARLIPQKKESRGRVRFLYEEEETRIREKILAHRPHCLEQFEIALHTGMRKGEQFTAEWSQVDFRQEYIHLDTTKNGSDRYVHLNPVALAALRRLQEVRKQRGFEFPTLFYNHKYKPIKDPKEWFKVTCEEAKVEGVTWHILRHTFASRLVMKGVGLKTIQELMGHKTIAMTARYAHLAPGHLRDAVHKLTQTESEAVA